MSQLRFDGRCWLLNVGSIMRDLSTTVKITRSLDVTSVLSSITKCEMVTSADDFRDKLTTGRIDSLLEELRKCVDAMEILVKDVEEQLQSMSESKVIALQSLTDLRRNINDRLDTLQKELTDKLTASFKEEKENLDISRKTCERLLFAMQKTLMSSQDATLKKDTVGTINLFQRGQAEVESCKGLILKLEKSSRSTIMKHDYNPGILALDTKASLTLGEIVVHQKDRKLPTTTLSTPLSKRQFKMTGKFCIKVPSDKRNCAAYGIVLLSGGRIVVGDSGNRKVKLFTHNGDFQCELGLRSESCDLCLIDDNTVAVTLMDVKTMCIVTVQDLTLSILSEIELQHVTEDSIEGATFINDSFLVGTAKSLYTVPRNGGETTKLHSVDSRCLHLANNQLNGHVFVSIYSTTSDDVAVARLSDGTRTCTYVLKVGVVKGATGVDVDMEGNVYVCGFNSHNVIQMSDDGTNVRELLTSSDGIKRPRAISVLGDQVVITSEGPDIRNLVYVYQLVNDKL